MKKVLFLSLAMAVAMTGFAQKPVVKKTDLANQPVKMNARVLKGNETQATDFGQQFVLPSVSNNTVTKGDDRFDEYQIMTTNYDLQSNSALGNRIATWPDGSAAFTATWDHSGNTSFPDRGTGYNFFSPEDGFGDEPEARIESVKAGWPSIAAMGNGEILASHANSKVQVYKRETKGQGEWENVWESPVNTTWPRIATTDNGQYVHLVSAEQNSSNTLENYVYYARSTDGGQTFTELAYPPLVDVEGMYRYDIGADDYVMATNGKNIAILFGGLNYDLFYIISHDNGETWEKQIIWNYPYDHSVDWLTTTYSAETDSIWSPDGSHSIAIDNNGTVHVAFGLIRWAPSEDHDGSYTYWPYTDGIVYWNSNFTNEQGTHEIPNFGDWSGDVNFPEMVSNGTNGISNTLNADRIWAMAETLGNNYGNLYVISAPDENGDGTVDFTDYWNNTEYHYRSHCISTMPGISVDEQGNMIIAYSTLSELRVSTEAAHHFRSCYVTARDYTGTWYENGINLSRDFMHEMSEVYSVTTAPQGSNGEFWVMYSEDEKIGLYLDFNDSSSSSPNSNNGGVLTENFIYGVKVIPALELEGWSVEEQEAINPMTSTRVYPNPASDVLNIEVNASQASDMSISVYNIMGQNVMNQNVNVTTGMNTRSINISELNSGIYFVTVKANGFENTMKFIVK